jgi:hypothetical protein
MFGSLLGGVLTTVLPYRLFYIGSYEVLHYHLVFALSSIGRFLSVIYIYYKSMDYDRTGRSIPQTIKDSFKQMIP